MSLNNSPLIVKDGLYGLWDFKNVKSYPGTGSTVTDIVGAKNLTIFGTPTYNSSGYLTFANDQATQYLMNSAYSTPVAEITYNVWFRSNFASSTQTPFTYSIAGDNHMLLFLASQTVIQPWPIGNSGWSVSTTNMTNVWVNISWTRVSSTGTNVLYRDGQQIGTFTSNANTYMTNNGYLIVGQETDSPGGGFDPAQNLDGDFAYFSIYDRALTSGEITQNFQALRGRFGI